MTGGASRVQCLLGVPRQRIHQYWMEKSAGPDAGPTPLLLAWVDARRSGVPMPDIASSQTYANGNVTYYVTLRGAMAVAEGGRRNGCILPR
ncbi:MAG: hypothetical protein A3G75_12980 [Verrucomicrobia bacterium RIFCSPLOWO2_12_FULL_64_8]|nr:MAG: hypothetical protein A3G75_12980 [Verrucomicrobia bacterium RIFCSPLOWO2_12_FULL_64_8]